MAKQPYTQANRPISVSTPLGQDKLLLEAVTGSEAISAPFRYDLEMLAETETQVAFEKLLGQSVTVTVLMPESTEKRYLTGVVSRVSQGPQVAAAQGGTTFIRYRAEIVPALSLLTRTARSRIFQQMAVPDILKKVLVGPAALKVTYQLQGKYESRDYCVQYRESDFAFASRLMEEEGIFYFFKHTDGAHEMVVADSAQAHPDLPAKPTKLIYDEVGGSVSTENRISVWEKSQELLVGAAALWDYNFELQGNNLEAKKTVLATAKAGTITHKLEAGGNDKFELYDYPGAYAGRFDGIDPGGGARAADLQKIFQDNLRTVGIRMQQETTPALLVRGESDCRHLVVGHKFTLDRHFDGNGAYVVVRVEREASLRGAYTSGGRTSLKYSNTFQCLPLDVPFRPQRTTPRPVVQGTQTAMVVGTKGQEIFTDKYGRVKVQFRWDREGKNDQNSSCWVRVGTPWAGKQWGIVHIPRIGQEVIVAFEEGDPDQPIIVGSVYNADQMPPYTLPDNMTQSGVKSRSTLKGEPTNFNELRFEDKKGSEEVYFHAEKDFNRVVENNDTLKVGSADSKTCPDGSQTIEIYKDRTETIKTGNETITIEKGNRTETIKEGNETILIEKGNRTETLKVGNETVTLETGSRTHSIKKDDTLNVDGNRTATIKGDDTEKVTGKQTVTITGDMSVTVSATQKVTVTGQVTIESTAGILLKVGPSSVKIGPDGITVSGPKVTVQGQALVQISAPLIQIG